MQNTFRNKKLIAIVLVLVAGYFLTKYGLLKWGSFRVETDATVTVTGTYSEQISNQIANFTIGVNEKNTDKDTAVKVSTERVDKIVTAIKGFGVDAKDIQTSSNIYQNEEPYYENAIQKFRKTDWVSYTTITVKLRQIEKVEDFTSMLYALEISDVNGPYFDLDTTGQTENETALLEKALDNAKAKAAALAKHENKILGEVVMISEGGAAGGPILYSAMDRGAGGGGGMQTGSSDVSKTVVVTYKIY